MLLNTSLLFELSVYRINEQSYYKKFNEYKSKMLADYPRMKEENIDIHNFGGSWEYNEIVGYLKFYISGKTQIRVEYSETASQRKRKARKKIFITRESSYCTREISSTLSNNEIIEILVECIEHCKSRLHRRYIKTDFFDATCEFTNWKQLLQSF